MMGCCWVFVFMRFGFVLILYWLVLFVCVSLLRLLAALGWAGLLRCFGLQMHVFCFI